MDQIKAAISAAERQAFTRPVPKSPAAQLRFLLHRAKGSTRALAEQLGVTQRSVQRYLKGERTPSGEAARRLAEQTEAAWQPRIRQRARQQASQRGVTVDLRGRFGFSAPAGTTDDPRTRRITHAIPAAYAARLFEATTEDDRRQAVADGLGEAYFRDGGSRAQGLGVELTDLDYIDMEFSA